MPKTLEPCSTEAAHVDLSVYNAARIYRLPGTWNRKGDVIPTRSHRMAEILHIPASVKTVTVETLYALAGTLTNEVEVTPKCLDYESNLVAEDFCKRSDIEPILEKHGWTLKSESDQQYWYRSSKTSGSHSATYNGDVFYLFTDNSAPFEPREGYSRFGART